LVTEPQFSPRHDGFPDSEKRAAIGVVLSSTNPSHFGHGTLLKICFAPAGSFNGVFPYRCSNGTDAMAAAELLALIRTFAPDFPLIAAHHAVCDGKSGSDAENIFENILADSGSCWRICG
jgi:hypothetical protein